MGSEGERRSQVISKFFVPGGFYETESLRRVSGSFEGDEKERLEGEITFSFEHMDCRGQWDTMH